VTLGNLCGHQGLRPGRRLAGRTVEVGEHRGGRTSHLSETAPDSQDTKLRPINGYGGDRDRLTSPRSGALNRSPRTPLATARAERRTALPGRLVR
jgi:hypothetical protein